MADLNGNWIGEGDDGTPFTLTINGNEATYDGSQLQLLGSSADGFKYYWRPADKACMSIAARTETRASLFYLEADRLRPYALTRA